MHQDCHSCRVVPLLLDLHFLNLGNGQKVFLLHAPKEPTVRKSLFLFANASRICCSNNGSATSRWLLNYSGVIEPYVLHCHLLGRRNGSNGGHSIPTVEAGKSRSQLNITLHFGKLSDLTSQPVDDSQKRDRRFRRLHIIKIFTQIRL